MFLSTARIGDVVYAGVKPGFRLILKDGRQITSSRRTTGFCSQMAGPRWPKQRVSTSLLTHAVWKELPSLYVNGKPLATTHLYSDADWLRYQYHTRGSGHLRDRRTGAVLNSHRPQVPQTSWIDTAGAIRGGSLHARLATMEPRPFLLLCGDCRAEAGAERAGWKKVGLAAVKRVISGKAG